MMRPILALLLLAPLLAAHADDTPAAAWLDRLSHSMSQLNYRGMLTFESGDHLESLRVTHGVIGGEEYERLEHLDGERREVIRRGEQLTCIYLGQRLSRLFRKQPAAGEQTPVLDAHYDLRTTGEGRVAGRHTMGISITPKDEYRFGYRLALDYDTGLLLRSELLGGDGHVLERFQFVEVDVGQPLKPEWIADATPQADATAAKAAATGPAPPAWKPQWLPAGFVLSASPKQSREDALTYSDGLAVMSIFLEPVTDSAPAGAGKARQGATVAYTRPLRRADRSYIVTVIGEVPQITAERVANSVDWVNP